MENQTPKRRRTKSVHTREWIENEIRIGNFTRGTALPPEHELAEQIGVSYMTLRKAVAELIADGLLERARGCGVFVSSEIPEQKAQRVLGLVMPAWSAPENLDTIMYFSKACEEVGWLLKIIYVRQWEDRSILDLYEACDALALMPIQETGNMPRYLSEKLRSPAKPVVVTGGSAEFIGRDGIFYRENSELEKPCDRLYELGHRRILLIDQLIRRHGKSTTIHTGLKGIEAVFHRKYPDVEYNNTLMTPEIPVFEFVQDVIRGMILEKQTELAGYTAVVCPLSFFWAVVSGLRDIDLRVPEDMSVLTFGDRREAKFYCPRPAVFSCLLEDQAYRTVELVLRRIADPDAPPAELQTASRFIEGETIAAAKTPKRSGN